MKDSDLSRLSVPQLDRLIKLAEQERANRLDRVSVVARKARVLAAAAGVSLDDLISALTGSGGHIVVRRTSRRSYKGKTRTPNKPRAIRGRKRPSSPVIKYRHPENAALTWSGRGTQARWIREWLRAKRGRTIDDLLVKN